MNILVLCDDPYHPAQIVREGLKPLTAQGYHFVWVEDARAWSAELIALFPVTILAKSNNISSQDQAAWLSPEVEQSFVSYVHQGGGLLALHSGTAGYQECLTLRRLLGGLFDHHPEQCPVMVTPLAGHPIARRAGPFTLVDEHYHMAMDANDLDVFLTTQSQYGTQPGGWRRAEERGRVCVLTPGHNLEVLQHPSYQALLSNALEWIGEER